MIKRIVKQWEENKSKLEEYFKTTKQEDYSEYKVIVEKLFELVLTEKEYDIKNITKIDNGDYQGLLLFVIPEETYQPYINEYLFTYVSYGSCSGCDTLQGIQDNGGDNYGEGLPTEEQVKGYMTLALHMIQRMKEWGDMEEE